MSDNPIKAKTTTALTIGKDLVALLRDGILFIFAILLIAFPNQFNTILTDAGFEEGSMVGLKWKSKLVDTDDQLQEALANINSLQQQNNELTKALTEAQKELENSPLKQKLEKLGSESKELNKQTEQVQQASSNTIVANSPFIQKALASSEFQTNADKGVYLVGLQTVGIDDSERLAINMKLQAEGYGLDKITYSYAAGERPSWFALSSTVFYYSSSSKKAAQELAGYLRSITGETFKVQRGAGLGVDKDLKSVTFFVHWIKR